MTNKNDYVESEKEREEGHVDTATKILNAKTKTPIGDVTGNRCGRITKQSCPPNSDGYELNKAEPKTALPF